MEKYQNWEKNITIFLASQTLTLFGSSLVQYAILWYITLKTQSGIMMTISIISGFIPSFFISPFAGVWADRYSRKMLIIISDLTIAFFTLILAVMFFIGEDSLILIFLVSAIRSLGSGVQTPAVGAFIPSIVPEDKLTRVNGINTSIQSFIFLLSPMLSGALMMTTDIEYIFFIDVITAIIGVLALLIFLKVPLHKKAEENEKIEYFQDMLKGIKYIKEHAFIKILFLYSAAYFILAAPLAFLTPLQVARTYGDDVWRLTAIEIAFSVGMMLGGALMAYWGGFQNKLHSMAMSTFIIAISTLILGIPPSFWVYLIVMGIAGLVMPLFNTPFIVLIQQKTDENYLGRVLGVLNMIASIVMPMAMLLFGPLSDVIKIEWLLLVTGSLIFVQGIFMVKNKVLLEAGRKDL